MSKSKSSKTATAAETEPTEQTTPDPKPETTETPKASTPAPVKSADDIVYPVKYVPAPETSDEGEEPDPDEVTPLNTEEESDDSDEFVPPNIDKESWSHLQKEMEDNGKLSDKAYEYLAGQGYPKNFVDQYISNQLAGRQVTEDTIYGDFGGRSGWESEFAPWANENLTPEQKNEFNEALKTKDVAKIKQAMQTVKQLREDAEGKAAAVVIEGRKPDASTGVKPFASPQAYQKAIGDPRWLTDDEYTADVRARWSASRARGMRMQ